MEAPRCACGEPIERRGKTGVWPIRCRACQLVARRAIVLASYYRTSEGKVYKRGTKGAQSSEHIRKRAESMAATLAGQRRTCESCGADYAPTQAAQRYCAAHKRYRKPGEATRPQHRRIYLPHGPYEQLLAEQGGGCGICGEKSEQRLSVDHDHATGQVRGLLCRGCNMGLGGFQDDTVRLRRAVEYLRVASKRSQLRLTAP